MEECLKENAPEASRGVEETQQTPQKHNAALWKSKTGHHPPAIFYDENFLFFGTPRDGWVQSLWSVDSPLEALQLVVHMSGELEVTPEDIRVFVQHCAGAHGWDIPGAIRLERSHVKRHF